MSLINDMLKNLEKRKAGEEKKENDATKGISAVEDKSSSVNEIKKTIIPPKKTVEERPNEPMLVGNNKHSKKRAVIWRLATLGFVAILVAAYVYIKMMDDSTVAVPVAVVKKDLVKPIEEKITTVEKIIEKETPQAKRAAKHTPVLTKLNTITITSKGKETMLTLGLTDETRYTINEDKGTLTVKLSETEANADVEKLTLDNEVVRAWQLVEEGSDLYMTFQLTPDVQLGETKYMNKDGEQLIITLKKTTVSDIVAKIEEGETENLVIKKLIRKKPATPLEKATKQYREALTEINNGEATLGVARLKNTLTDLPDFDDARIALVIYQLDHGKQFEAELYLKKGLEVSPHFIPFQLLKVRLLLDKGRPEQALSALSSISADEKNAVEYYALTGAINLRLKNFMSAERAYETLVEIEPSNGRWWLGLGISSQALGNENVAKEAYAQAKRLGNNDWHIQSYLNKQLHTLKD